jgi:hypothetical protein
VRLKKRPKPYQAVAKLGGKLVHLGYFRTAEEASCIVENVLASAHGEFYRRPSG